MTVVTAPVGRLVLEEAEHGDAKPSDVLSISRLRSGHDHQVAIARSISSTVAGGSSTSITSLW